MCRLFRVVSGRLSLSRNRRTAAQVSESRDDPPTVGAVTGVTAGSIRPVEGYRDLLRSRPYVGLLVSRLVSMIGDQLARVALTVLVFQRTGSGVLSAATYAASFLPAIVAGPLLGGLADRFPRRRVLVLADLIRAVLFACMALPGLSLPVLLGLVLLAGTAEAPWTAARAPLMRDVLLDDRGYRLGTGVDEALDQSGQVVGFALAGALLVVLSPQSALLLDAASFLGSAAVVRLLLVAGIAADALAGQPAARIRGLAGVVAAVRRHAAQSVQDAAVGWRAASSSRGRRPMLLTWVGVSCVVAPEAVATPWAIGLGAGPIGIGLLFAAAPLGSVFGLLFVGRVSDARAERLLLPLAVLSIVPLAVCLTNPVLPVVLALVWLSGVGVSFSLLARVAFVQAVEGPHRGRAFSVAAAGVTAGQGFGITVVGALTAVVAPAVAVGVVGVIGLVLLAGTARLTGSRLRSR